MQILWLAFCSGIPALVYQVGWTRQVGLIVGTQAGAIAIVLAAFFGGLAAGSHWLGGRSDRAPRPLLFYAGVELAAGLTAAAAVFALSALADGALVGVPRVAMALLCGLLLVPTTFLLGGTQPALLRALQGPAAHSAHTAGRIVAANTSGAVCGVVASVAAIPRIGIVATLLAAAAVSAALAAVARCLDGRSAVRSASPPRTGVPRPATAVPFDASDSLPSAPGVLFAASAVGAATLGFEVLSSRLAIQLLGSSLHAWAAVLALFLIALSLGNLASARAAGRSSRPARALGSLELAAACCVLAGAGLLAGDPAGMAEGLRPAALLRVAVATLPGAFCMGAAFPFFVRLAVVDERVGGHFGTLTAANTAGGIFGSLLVPAALLPAVGPLATAGVCALANAVVGTWLLVRAGAWARLALGASTLAGLGLAFAVAPRSAGPARLVFVDHGWQATAAVAELRGRRELIVDGDPEASTAGRAQRTERLIAALPLLVHPAPKAFIELGLGSGTTLATAAGFPFLERIECAEIARSVLRAARHFAPINDAAFADPRVSIVHADARMHLLLRRGVFDVAAANTLHPWSVGATGLYSREYFRRVSGALAPGGVAVQWLPLDRVGLATVRDILRTFYAVFPDGLLYWGDENLLALGHGGGIAAPDTASFAARLRAAGLDWAALGLVEARDLSSRLIARADALRALLGTGPVLSDDRPILEGRAGAGRAAAARSVSGSATPGAASPAVTLRAWLAEVAERSAGDGVADAALAVWLRSRAEDAAGNTTDAAELEAQARASGLRLAAESAAWRAVRIASAALAADDSRGARAQLLVAIRSAPTGFAAREALFSLAGLDLEAGRPRDAAARLETLLAAHPDDAEAWNQLAVVRSRLGPGRSDSARIAVERALAANPFFSEGLANAGLLAAARGDERAATAFLERLRALPGARGSELERALSEALRRPSP